MVPSGAKTQKQGYTWALVRKNLLQPEQGMVGMHLGLVQEHSLGLKSLKHCQIVVLKFRLLAKLSSICDYGNLPL
jgi:hypothetical protein